MSDLLPGPVIAAQFEAIARECFSFLIPRGFSVSVVVPHPDVRIVRFVAQKTYIEVRLVPPAYEPEMVFGELGVDDQKGNFDLEIGDLVRAGATLPTANSRVTDKFQQQITWLADVLKQCGTELIEEKLGALPGMRLGRRKEVDKWLKQETASEQRALADKAWAAKDFGRYLQLTANAVSANDAVTMKRREIAKKAV